MLATYECYMVMKGPGSQRRLAGRCTFKRLDLQSWICSIRAIRYSSLPSRTIQACSDPSSSLVLCFLACPP